MIKKKHIAFLAFLLFSFGNHLFAQDNPDAIALVDDQLENSFYVLNALRLTDGVEVRLFSERTGLSLNSLDQSLDAAEAKGLLRRDHLRIAPTLLGQRFLNDLQQMFLPD